MPPNTTEPDVGELLARMDPVDIVLDGFRRSNYPKMEIVPAGQDRALLAPADSMVLAITSDVSVAADDPCYALSDIGVLADFVLANARGSRHLSVI
jgi:molybdopterin-guanine dinucleotide biosynthesis protein